MVIKMSVESTEGLPPELAAEYREQDDGTFTFSPEFDQQGFGVGNIGQLKGKLDQATRDHARGTERLNSYKLEDGSLLSVEAYTDLLAKHKAAEDQITTLTDKTKSDGVRLAESISQAKQPLLERIKSTEAERETFKSQAFNAAKRRMAEDIVGKLKPHDRWRDHILAEVERNIGVEANGEGIASAHIVDLKTGEKLFSAASGSADALMTNDEFISSGFKAKFADLLQGDEKGGAGSSQGRVRSGGGRPGQNGQPLQITQTDSQDFALYNKMDAEAKKLGVRLDIIPD